VPTVKSGRPHEKDDRVRTYEGIGLRENYSDEDPGPPDRTGRHGTGRPARDLAAAWPEVARATRV
jgi:hypothetical protein